MKFPIGIVPKTLKVQPIQVEVVELELVKIIKRSPLNSTHGIGGKQIYNMKQIVDSFLKVRHQNKLMMNILIIGQVMNGFAKGYNTCDNISLTSNTLEDYLTNKYPKYILATFMYENIACRLFYCVITFFFKTIDYLGLADFEATKACIMFSFFSLCLSVSLYLYCIIYFDLFYRYDQFTPPFRINSRKSSSSEGTVIEATLIPHNVK
jgi:hypothetical protein